jgi:hypothetical protein
MTVLAGARGQRYEIGTNLKGVGTAAAWTLLLPRLDPETVLVIGSVTDAERAALSELAPRILVIERRAEAEALVQRSGRGGSPSIDVVRIGAGGGALLARVPGLRPLLAGSGDDPASTYVEWRGRAPVSEHPVGPDDELVLRPALGPARLIVPRRLVSMASRLPGARRAATPAARPGRWRVRVDRLANRILASGAFDRWSARRARLVTSSDGGGGPPAWIVGIAADAGVDVAGCGWALLAPGDYATQKVLLVLFDPADDRPRTIVKISPSPEHRGRLRTEAEALTHLAGIDAAVGAVPVVEFAGEHAGREIVGERWIDGRPFDAIAAVDADSPQYAAASGWLTSLAEATARPSTPGDVAAAMRDLLGRFRAVAPLTSAELDALDADVRAIASHAGRVPTVFQHGDPGTWNVMLDQAGRVVFLDWEASEPDGIPLWDLFHLQRSFGALSAQREGLRGTDASLRHLVFATPLHERFSSEIRDGARAVGLARELVAPLFFTCWMHRALKEVTRRTPATLDRAPYLRFLRAMLARRDDDAVRHLLVRERGA